MRPFCKNEKTKKNTKLSDRQKNAIKEQGEIVLKELRRREEKTKIARMMQD